MTAKKIITTPHQIIPGQKYVHRKGLHGNIYLGIQKGIDVPELVVVQSVNDRHIGQIMFLTEDDWEQGFTEYWDESESIRIHELTYRYFQVAKIEFNEAVQEHLHRFFDHLSFEWFYTDLSDIRHVEIPPQSPYHKNNLPTND